MKARVKATGNVVDVEWYGHDTMGSIYTDVTHTKKYYEYELDFNTVYDYWDKLLHQYAGMAMQGFISASRGFNVEEDVYNIPYYSELIATALVEKLKEGNK